MNREHFVTLEVETVLAGQFKVKPEAAVVTRCTTTALHTPSLPQRRYTAPSRGLLQISPKSYMSAERRRATITVRSWWVSNARCAARIAIGSSPGHRRRLETYRNPALLIR